MTVTVPIPIPSYETLANNLTFPGLNPAIESFNAVQSQLMDNISTLSSATDGIAANISSIKTQIESNLNSLKSQFGTMLNDIEIPTSSLQEDIFNALKLSSTDVAAFKDQIQTIAAKYPSADMNSIVSKFSDPNFSIVTDVPNLKIINGEEILKSLPEIKPTEAVSSLSKFVEIVNAEVPELEKRIQVITDKDKISFDNLVAEASKTDVFPTGKLEQIRSTMESKIRESLQDQVKLTDNLNRVARDATSNANDIITKFANEKRVLITLTGQTRDKTLESGTVSNLNPTIPEPDL